VLDSQGSSIGKHFSGLRLPTLSNMEFLQSEKNVFYTHCVRKIARLPPTRLQPAATATMCYHSEGDTHPPPSTHPFY